MGADLFAPPLIEPPLALPDALSDADYSPPPPLVRGNEPGEVVILIDADVFSG